MSLAAVRKAFRDYPAQMKVAEKMLALGLNVRLGALYCGDVEVKDVSIAGACDVDRRAVSATIKKIESNVLLRSVFSTLEPAGPFFLHSASAIGLRVIEIEPPNAAKPGIVAEVTSVLAKHRISIRQILSQDPELFENPKLFIVLQRKLPPRVFDELSSLKTVKKLSVY